MADQGNHRVVKWYAGASVGVLIFGTSGTSGSTVSLLNSPTSILLVNKNHKLTLVNREACELLVQSETELLGQDWFDVFVPDEIRAEKIAHFSEILAGDLDPRTGFEHPILTRDGEKAVRWRVAVIEDETGASAGAARR